MILLDPDPHGPSIHADVADPLAEPEGHLVALEQGVSAERQPARLHSILGSGWGGVGEERKKCMRLDINVPNQYLVSLGARHWWRRLWQLAMGASQSGSSCHYSDTCPGVTSATQVIRRPSEQPITKSAQEILVGVLWRSDTFHVTHSSKIMLQLFFFQISG